MQGVAEVRTQLISIAPDWLQRLAPRIKMVRQAKDASDRAQFDMGMSEQELHRQLALLGAELMLHVETLPEDLPA